MNQMTVKARRRRWYILGLSILSALLLLLLVAALGNAGRIGDWSATEFQLQNLDEIPAHFDAVFIDALGNPIHEFTGSILPGHTALMSTIVVGKLRYKTADGEVVLAVNRGFVEVLDDVVTVLTETCESGDEIDPERARKALERAQSRLQEALTGSDLDVARAEYALQRALARLRAAGKQAAE